MTTTGAHAWVADLYDDYVTTTVDVPFFLDELRGVDGPVLELMCGTGRLSIPLADAGARLTCVDLSGPMLARLRAKLRERDLRADVFEMDVAELALPERDYALALLPFQSFAELPTAEAQRRALAAVAAHLRPGGRFICTLHNPPVRRRAITGGPRLIGTFPLAGRRQELLLWSVERTGADAAAVQGTQLYDLYDEDGRLQESRKLDIVFRLVERAEFAALATAAGFEVVDLYGDYGRAPFDDERSPFMIWVLRRA
jgi:SAM-dependent methyltransferase